MIKANELRIGNWFKSNIYQQVELQHLEYLLNENFAPHDALTPILLTPEILQSAGFEKSKAEWEDGYYYFKYPITIYAERDVERITVGMNRCEHKYLHQLQNLYYCLTCKELEINLNA